MYYYVFMADGGYRSTTGAVVALEAALDAVLAEPLSRLSVEELAGRSCALERVASRLKAARCATLAAVDGSPEAPGVLRSLGYRSAGELAADRVGVDPKPVRRLSRTGAWLIDFRFFPRPLPPAGSRIATSRSFESSMLPTGTRR